MIKEEPFYMGQSLKGVSNVLDIQAEERLMLKTIEQLRSEYTDDNHMAINSAMKDFGLERFCHMHPLNIYIY